MGKNEINIHLENRRHGKKKKEKKKNSYTCMQYDKNVYTKKYNNSS